MAPKKPRPRTARRTLERADEKAHANLADARRQLAALDAGGRSDAPLEVTSASVIDGLASSLPCLACEERVRVVTHDAAVLDGARRRVVTTRCSRCGEQRTLYFSIESPLPN